MIWHIFKKDLKLLWLLALLVAIVHIIAALLYWLQDHNIHTNELDTLTDYFPLLGLGGSAILSFAIIQTDPIPGDRDDWLLRPIRPSTILAAKLLFVLLAAVTPVFIAGAFEVYADGFSITDSAGAALGRSAALFVLFCLPGMVLGAITHNAIEAIVGGAAAAVLTGGFVLAILFLGVSPQLRGSGLAWWSSAFLAVVIVAGAVPILCLQYYGRYTSVSRFLSILFFLLACVTPELPWKPFFSSQMLISKDTSGDGVALSFDPSLPRSLRTARDTLFSTQDPAPVSLINLPIQAAGVPASDVLLADRASIRLIADGKTIYQQPIADSLRIDGAGVTVVTQFRQESDATRVLNGYQVILLPNSVFDAVRTRELTLEIDYSLTLFRKDASAALDALDDSKRLDNLGWCKTRIVSNGDAVELRCVNPGQAPNCISAVLENSATKLRNPEKFICQPDYSPFPIHFVEDDLVRGGGKLNIRDADSLAKYPVNSSQLNHARVNMISYQPTGHFTRRVIVRNVRLGDWVAPPAP